LLATLVLDAGDALFTVSRTAACRDVVQYVEQILRALSPGRSPLRIKTQSSRPAAC
jgi:hypothetical protein